MTAAKIAISLPTEVLALVEAARQTTGESRSEFFLHAVEAYLARQRAEVEADLYARGYERLPETAEEVQAIDRMGAAVLAAEPWD